MLILIFVCFVKNDFKQTKDLKVVSKKICIDVIEKSMLFIRMIPGAFNTRPPALVTSG